MKHYKVVQGMQNIGEFNGEGSDADVANIPMWYNSQACTIDGFGFNSRER
jgi:hypothetical protein